MSSEQLRKIGNIATLLGVTPQTLRNWTNSGYMDVIIGNRDIGVSEGVKWNE